MADTEKTQEQVILDDSLQKKQKARLSQEKRQRALMLVLSIVSLLALLTSVTFSWFIYPESLGTYAPVHADVKLPPNLTIGQLKSGVVDWDNELGLTAIYPISPVVGDGVHFYTKSLTAFDASAYSNLSVTGDGYQLYSYVVPDGLIALDEGGVSANVGIVDFVVQSVYPGNLYLSTESTFSPSFTESPRSVDMPSVSTGYIAGALRLAIFQADSAGNYQLRCIWIPNPTYQFDNDTTTFTPTGTAESNYTFYSPSGSSVVSRSISTTANDGYYVDENGVLYVWDVSKCNVPFGTYATAADGNFRAVFWLDGGDRECVNALAGGKVDLSLGIYIDGEE